MKKRLPNYREAFTIYLHFPAAHLAFVQRALHSVVHFFFVHFLQSTCCANAETANIAATANTMNFFMFLIFT
jgi:hypothetical protein